MSFTLDGKEYKKEFSDLCINQRAALLETVKAMYERALITAKNEYARNDNWESFFGVSGEEELYKLYKSDGSKEKFEIFTNEYKKVYGLGKTQDSTP